MYSYKKCNFATWGSHSVSLKLVQDSPPKCRNLQDNKKRKEKKKKKRNLDKTLDEIIKNFFMNKMLVEEKFHISITLCNNILLSPASQPATKVRLK